MWYDADVFPIQFQLKAYQDMTQSPKPVISTDKKAVRRRIPKWALHSQEDAPSSDKYFLRSIGRAVDILDAFDGQKPLSLKDLHKQTKLPDSTVFRVLLTLESRGYLIQASDGTYQLAPKLQVGWQMSHANILRDQARPELELLANKFNETVSLAQLFDDRIHVLDCIEAFHDIRIANKIGRVLPPHCSAMGKAITAFQERALIDRILEVYGLFPRTEHTIVDRFSLFQRFEIIRKTGIGYDREESVLGGLCIAAAIQPKGMPVTAAISISTPMVRMTEGREKETCDAVLKAAQNIAKILELAS
jgi:DNA-binding IclR family transcriptional regulator